LNRKFKFSKNKLLSNSFNLSNLLEIKTYKIRNQSLKLTLKREIQRKIKSSSLIYFNKLKLNTPYNSLSPHINSILSSQKLTIILEWIKNYIESLLKIYHVHKYKLVINSSRQEVIFMQDESPKIIYKYIDYPCALERVKKIINTSQKNELKTLFFFSQDFLDQLVKKWIIDNQGLFLYINYDEKHYKVYGKIHQRNNSVSFSLESCQPRELIVF
jgi:hypothetical protein